jgi:hypothetical protein
MNLKKLCTWRGDNGSSVIGDWVRCRPVELIHRFERNQEFDPIVGSLQQKVVVKVVHTYISAFNPFAQFFF